MRKSNIIFIISGILVVLIAVSAVVFNTVSATKTVVQNKLQMYFLDINDYQIDFKGYDFGKQSYIFDVNSDSKVKNGTYYVCKVNGKYQVIEMDFV